MLGHNGICSTGNHISTSFETGDTGGRHNAGKGGYIVKSGSAEGLDHSGLGNEGNC